MATRIGAREGERPSWHAVKRHPFFKGFSFDKLLARQLDAPHVPPHKNCERDTDVESAVDISEVSDSEDDSWDEESAFSSVSSASEAEVQVNELPKSKTRGSTGAFAPPIRAMQSSKDVARMKRGSTKESLR